MQGDDEERREEGAAAPPAPHGDVERTPAKPMREGWLERYIPERIETRVVASFACTLAVLSYVLVLLTHRFENAFQPFTAEGDAKQTVWQFYRYYDEGVLPLGHLMTDYAWVYNAPPFYRAIMVPFSTFLDPILVGNLLHLGLYVGALIAMYWICRSQVNHYCGLAAVTLFARTPTWHHATAGGHARSFGVTLVLLFVGAWVTNRRRLCLFILILQAGTYPPPAIACSFAFGTWTLWRFLKDREWRPVVELAVTGVIVLLLAKSQDLLSAEWWGSPVWYKDVLNHAAFQRGSRMEFVPHESPVFNPAWRYITALYKPDGRNWIDGLSQWDRGHGYLLVLAPALFAMGAAWALRVRFPKRVLWLFVCGFLAYLLAREMAFKLHVPTRPIREIWTPVFPLILALSTFLAAYAYWPRRRLLPTIVAIVLLLGPAFVVHRNGIGSKGPYGNNERNAQLFTWVRESTPKDAVFAGTYRGMDLIGLFGWRIPYVNWAQAHPFRPGYWAEVERRTMRMYEAYWAVDLDTVLEFTDEEDIDYLMIDMRHTKRFKETNSAVMPFPPLRSRVQAYWKRCRAKRCVLFEDDVEPAVVQSHRHWRIIDVEKLRGIADKIPAYAPPAPPTPQPLVPGSTPLPDNEGAPPAPAR